MIVIGILICLGTHFAARRGLRRWLRIPGVRTVSKVAEPSYFQTARGRRFAWRLAGPSAAYALATVLVLSMLLANGEQQSGTRIIVRPGAPAAAAGLQTNDRIIAIDGTAPTSWPDVQQRLAVVGPGRSVSLSVDRNGARLSLTATTNGEGRLGISPALELRPKPFGEALVEAAGLPIVGAIRAARPLWTDLVDAPRTELAGPVGIVRAIGAEPVRPLARSRFLLTLLAFPTALVWPISPFVELLLTPRRRRVA
jgi:membrane-associated protease RseP (regulator of RpoE activity)